MFLLKLHVPQLQDMRRAPLAQSDERRVEPHDVVDVDFTRPDPRVTD